MPKAERRAVAVEEFDHRPASCKGCDAGTLAICKRLGSRASAAATLHTEVGSRRDKGKNGPSVKGANPYHSSSHEKKDTTGLADR